MTDQAPELLPCPFCGAGDKFVGVVASQDMEDGEYVEDGRRWSVICGKCGSSCSLYCVSEQEAVAAWNTRPTPSERPVAQVREALGARQRVVIEWGERCFGVEHMRDKIVRAARFFEEAAELVQAVGLPRDHAMRAFDHVYSRDPGEPAQEVGGVANTLMALCGAVGLSFDACQIAEIDRCLAKDPSHFAKRNETKLRDVDALTSERPSEAAVAWTEEERHAIAHARHQVEQASPEKPDCCFDFDLVKDLLRVIDRSAPHGDAVRALEPFAKIADHIDDLAKRHGGNYTDAMTVATTIGNCRAALAALSPTLASERVSERGTTTSVPQSLKEPT